MSGVGENRGRQQAVVRGTYDVVRPDDHGKAVHPSKLAHDAPTSVKYPRRTRTVPFSTAMGTTKTLCINTDTPATNHHTGSESYYVIRTTCYVATHPAHVRRPRLPDTFGAMASDPLHVIVGELTRDAALDTATSRAILQRVNSGELPATLQVGMPHDVVAFGKHDSLTPGFTRAVAIAQNQGFDVTVRIAGGRAVVFHPGTVRFAWTVPDDQPAETMHARFETLASAVVAALEQLGVDAQIGELANEYCAGSYSVHLKGGGKVMGVGQRLARHAAQVGGMIVVNDAASINAVLEPVYSELDIVFDPNMTGAISDVQTLDPQAVADALAASLAPEAQVTDRIDAETQTLAASLRPDHVPPHLRERTERP